MIRMQRYSELNIEILDVTILFIYLKQRQKHDAVLKLQTHCFNDEFSVVLHEEDEREDKKNMLEHIAHLFTGARLNQKI